MLNTVPLIAALLTGCALTVYISGPAIGMSMYLGDDIVNITRLI